MQKYTNNASTTLAAGIGAGDVSCTVVDGSGFPVLGVDDWNWLTLESANGADIEIVKVTARVGNVLTMVRAQQDTVAVAFLLGATAELRWTKSDADEALFDVDNVILNPMVLGII